LDALLAVPVVVLRIAVGSQPELGDGEPLGADDDLRVASQAADQLWALDWVQDAREFTTRSKYGSHPAFGTGPTSRLKSLRVSASMRSKMLANRRARCPSSARSQTRTRSATCRSHHVSS